jgi:addiction module HigA family antidote
MRTTKLKPATVGEILVEEFMQPIGLRQAALAEAMSVQRKHINELCDNGRTAKNRRASSARSITADKFENNAGRCRGRHSDGRIRVHPH